MRPNEDRAMERALEAFLSEVRRYAWFDVSSQAEGGLACVCVVFGDHPPETDPPCSREAIKLFLQEETHRSYWRISGQYKDRAQNNFK